jgi:hypothetical protein
VADHFRDKAPATRALFRRFRDLVRACGPVHMYAQKTRIVFQVRARFAGVTPRKRHLVCTVWLRRRVESGRFSKIEFLPPDNYIHTFHITGEADLDDVVAALLREAYAVGRQA